VNCAILGQHQGIISDSHQQSAIGFIWIYIGPNLNTLYFQYATGSAIIDLGIANFFLNYNNQ